jgi:predicted nucleotidyltransferase
LQIEHLAQILDDWVAPTPTIPSVYLFGSRVRGDHRPDSDVDVRLFLDEWRALDVASVRWWSSRTPRIFQR